jgi:hypothetical protein
VKTIDATAAWRPVPIGAPIGLPPWVAHVQAVDLDRDGLLDVLASESRDNVVVWIRQVARDVFEEITIAADLPAPVHAEAADLDGDGDLDVLSASQEDDQINWYRNTNGLGSFSAPILVTQAANGASTAMPVDMDGDNDLDILISGQNDDTISWFENLNGAATFSGENVISTDSDGPKCVLAADFDVDGDADVVATSYNDDRLKSIKGYLDMWNDLGFGLAGTSGVPLLTPSGVILPGNTLTLKLTSAKSTATVAMIIGISSLNLPLKGGTLVPSLDVFLFGTSNGNGVLNFVGPWPAGLPSGFTFFMQEWIVDSAGPQGFAATNGLRGKSD